MRFGVPWGSDVLYVALTRSGFAMRFNFVAVFASLRAFGDQVLGGLWPCLSWAFVLGYFRLVAGFGLLSIYGFVWLLCLVDCVFGVSVLRAFLRGGGDFGISRVWSTAELLTCDRYLLSDL